jgi:hypothetical protein
MWEKIQLNHCIVDVEDHHHNAPSYQIMPHGKRIPTAADCPPIRA